MSNPTLITSGFQKHVKLRAPHRSNTFAEQNALIIGSSARLRGLTFVSENSGVDVTLSSGDFISIGAILDASMPTREAGIMVRMESSVTIDVSGFTNPYIYAYASNTLEDSSSPVQFLATEAAPAPNSLYAPIIYKTGGVWISNQAIGNDELAGAGILASGTDTKPVGVSGYVTITHNLGLASYKVLLQPINLTAPTYTINGISTFPEVGELYIINQGINSFDVVSDSSQAANFVWAVIA